MPGTEILRVRCYTSSLFALKCRLTYFSSCLLHNLTYLNCFVELNSPKDVFATEHVLTPGEDMRFEPWTLVTTRGTLPRNRSHRAASLLYGREKRTVHGKTTTTTKPEKSGTEFLWIHFFFNHEIGCVSLRKSKIGFLNPKESENGFCVQFCTKRALAFFPLLTSSLLTKLALSIVHFCRRKRSFQWCPGHSDRSYGAWDMHKNAQKVQWAINSE